MSGILDHEMTLTEVSTKIKPSKEQITKRWFKEHHYLLLAANLQQKDWSIMNGKNVDEMAELLEATIKKALDEIVPIETKKVRVQRINRWMTKGIKVSVNNAQNLYKKGKKKSG